jgi:hypothetical protein
MAMNKRTHDRTEMSVSCRIANAEDVFGSTRGGWRRLAGAIMGGFGQKRGLDGLIRNISSGGAMIEIDRGDFNRRAGGGGREGFYMLAAEECLDIELMTSPEGEHITQMGFRPSRIKLSREKIQIGGAFVAGAKNLIPVQHRDANGLVITWP